MGLRFTISPQSFFQVNPDQAERLYAAALQAAGLGPGCGMNVLDAYCGAGTITLCAARNARHVTGIEIVPPAIADAKRNASRNGLESKAGFLCGDAATEIPRLLKRGERFDAAILDPPRKGADAALLEAIADARIPALAYVSCNPATLARDVKRLAARGYRLEWAQPVDMFPFTGSTEVAARLAKHATGVEIVPPAIADAKKNAQRNGLAKKSRFICADAAKEIPKLIASGERFDAAIIDPPRKGADEKLLRALIQAAPGRISYVSCNPATLARDVKILAEGGYRLEWAQPVDMFPWTGHVECVVRLYRP
jgi:tRNA/tmRNA/rRNA uracil-C5-methylase (TrmA/RlmC/RlmD family)